MGKIVIGAAGDILITKRIPEGNEGIERIADFWKDADVRLANLETTVTDGTCFPSAYSGGTWLTCDPDCLLDVKKYGFDLLGLANNHIMDYSYDGLIQTLENVKKYGFQSCGCGMNLYQASRAAFLETKGGRIGILQVCSTFNDAARAGNQTERMSGRPGLSPLRFKNINYVSNEHAKMLQEISDSTGINLLREKHRAQGFIPQLQEGQFEIGTNLFCVTQGEEGRRSYVNEIDMERTLSAIKEAQYTCDAVVVMVHSHEIKKEREDEADYFLEEFARRCIDAGACTVIGSGTHQLKGIEIYKECPIFYCLGNFIFENEFVRDLPADYMEQYHLPVNASGAEGIQGRKKQSSHSLYDSKEVYYTVLPKIKYEDDRATEIELLPVELGTNKERHEKNIPYPATGEEAERILDCLNAACEPYNTSWCMEGNVFVQRTK